MAMTWMLTLHVFMKEIGVKMRVFPRGATTGQEPLVSSFHEHPHIHAYTHISNDLWVAYKHVAIELYP